MLLLIIYFSNTATIVVPEANVTKPCTPSPCGINYCDIYDGQVAICNPCAGPNAFLHPHCRPECLTNSDCPFNKACIGQTCSDPCPGSCGVNAICDVIHHSPICSCPKGLAGNPFDHCAIISSKLKKNAILSKVIIFISTFQFQMKKQILAKISDAALTLTAYNKITLYHVLVSRVSLEILG